MLEGKAMRRGTHVVGVGYSCLDRICVVEDFPVEDSSTHILSMETQGGGAVATAIVTAAKLGAQASYVGNVGMDSISDEMIRLLNEGGVSTESVARRKDAYGLESFIMVNPQTASRTKFPMRDFNPPIEWTDELKGAILSADILHLDGTHYENAISAARIAKGKVFVSLDGCSMQKDMEKNRALASMADCLVMNSKYPLRVSGEDDHEKALMKMSKWGPQIVMCTLGANGVLAVIDGQAVRFPAFKVKAVDTTGAGDVFHGAFIAGYLEGMEIQENIRFASAAAALKCLKPGGRAGIPKREDVLAMLNSNGE